MTIKETRRMYMDDLRGLCIKHNWFTHADCRTYDRFLQMCDNGRKNITTKNLHAMALMIRQYSDPETYEILETTGIMFCLAEICLTCFSEEEG